VVDTSSRARGRSSTDGARPDERRFEALPLRRAVPRQRRGRTIAADWGRKEIRIAETEMPGLMAIRDEFAPSSPLKGARITGSLHIDDPDRRAGGDAAGTRAPRAWASCNIFSTQDHAAAALVVKGTPVFAYKGETLADYWDYTPPHL